MKNFFVCLGRPNEFHRGNAACDVIKKMGGEIIIQYDQEPLLKRLLKFYIYLRRYKKHDIFLFVPAEKELNCLVIVLLKFLGYRAKLISEWYIWPSLTRDDYFDKKIPIKSIAIRFLEIIAYSKVDKFIFTSKAELINSTKKHKSLINKSYFIDLCFKFDANEIKKYDKFRDELIESNERLTIGFWGSGIPLQGLKYIENFIHLNKSINWILIVPKNNSHIQELRSLLDNCKEYEHLKIYSNGEYEDLSWRSIVARHCHASLGVFGDSKKANAVTPNKLVESLSMRIPVITNNTLGIIDNTYRRGVLLVNDKANFRVTEEFKKRIDDENVYLSNMDMKEFRQLHSIDFYKDRLSEIFSKNIYMTVK